MTRKSPSPSPRRPLIKAVKGMLAVSFIGGCRLGGPDPYPGTGGSAGATNSTSTGGTSTGSTSTDHDAGPSDAATGG